MTDSILDLSPTESVIAMTKIHGNIQRYLSSSRVKPVVSMLSEASSTLLRSELYLQVLQQTLKPDMTETETVESWKLMCMLVSAFLPKEPTLQDIILAYLRYCQDTLMFVSASYWAVHCLSLFERRQKCGERSYLPSLQELEAIQSGAIYIEMSVDVPGAGSVKVPLDSCMTALEATEKCLELLNLSPFVEHFGLTSLEKGRRLGVPILRQTNMTDFLCSCSSHQRFHISLDLCMWNLSPSQLSHSNLLQFVAHSIRKKVLDDVFYVNEEVLMRLASLSQAAFQLVSPTSHTLSEYVPARMCNSKVLEGLLHVNSSPSEALLMYSNVALSAGSFNWYWTPCSCKSPQAECIGVNEDSVALWLTEGSKQSRLIHKWAWEDIDPTSFFPAKGTSRPPPLPCSLDLYSATSNHLLGSVQFPSQEVS